jgi:hypothetical protein
MSEWSWTPDQMKEANWFRMRACDCRVQNASMHRGRDPFLLLTASGRCLLFRLTQEVIRSKFYDATWIRDDRVALGSRAHTRIDSSICEAHNKLESYILAWDPGE